MQERKNIRSNHLKTHSNNISAKNPVPWVLEDGLVCTTCEGFLQQLLPLESWRSLRLGLFFSVMQRRILCRISKVCKNNCFTSLSWYSHRAKIRIVKNFHNLAKSQARSGCSEDKSLCSFWLGSVLNGQQGNKRWMGEDQTVSDQTLV